MGAGDKRAAEVSSGTAGEELERGTKRPKPEASSGNASSSDSEPSPPVFKKGSAGDGYTLDPDSGFYMHDSAQWMYNEGDDMYVHLASGSVWTVDAAGNASKMAMDVPELSESTTSPELQQQQQASKNSSSSNGNNNAEADGDRVTGVINWFNVKKSYGFIQLVSSEEDLFCHQNAVVDGTQLAQDMEVR